MLKLRHFLKIKGIMKGDRDVKIKAKVLINFLWECIALNGCEQVCQEKKERAIFSMQSLCVFELFSGTE